MVAIATVEQRPALPTGKLLECELERFLAIEDAVARSCPPHVAAAWAEDFPPPQSSFNVGLIEPVEPPPPASGCARCYLRDGHRCMSCTGDRYRRQIV